MGILLPASMAHERRFICTNCGYKYRRVSPASVDKCPLCERKGAVMIAYERGVDPNKLDPYSEHKKRWYADPTGKAHEESIKHRVFKKVDGQKIVVETDSKGRVIEAIPTPAIPQESKTPAIKE